jgi:hypothetical protein
MKSPRITILAGLLLPVAAALAVDLQLTVTRKTPLKGELEDRVTFGLLKEMTCDSSGNIFTPSNRKYGSAINAIVRFPRDASSFTDFPIDSDDGVDGGTITDFDLESSGELFALVRQVLKYSDVEVPIEFGKSFLIHYDQAGKIRSRLELKLDTNNFEPTGIAMLQGGEILVVGRRVENHKTFLICEVFLQTGNLKTRFALNPEGTRSSKTGTVLSPRVIEPLAIRANGFVYVLRGTTIEPVYVLSETGQLLKTIHLKLTEMEFDSPKILGNELIVRDHLRQPPQSTLSVFSLETGEVVDRYFWQHNGAAGLACATPPSLTFIGQDVSHEDIGWAIFETLPGGTSRTKPSATGH